MIYTVIFYLILALVASLAKDRKIAIKWLCIIVAIYMGIRYDYTPDYPAYQRVFEQFSERGYEYDATAVHVEYGWYLINKLFAPFGYYFFVFFCSCIFAYGIYSVMKIYAPSKYLALIILGIVSYGSFTTLLSAQRQLLVTAIFLIAYRHLIYNKIKNIKSLISKPVLLYFLIIYLCSFFHTSGIILWVIPFLYILPKKSILVILGIVASTIFLLTIGSRYLPGMFETYADEYGYYNYIDFRTTWAGSITVLQFMMWVFQIVNVIYVYRYHNLSDGQKTVLLISIFAILITLSGYSVSQVGRLAHYIYIFSFLAIGVVAKKFEGTNYGKIYILANYIWVFWNLLKVFSINVGSFQEYKTIFSVL